MTYTMPTFKEPKDEPITITIISKGQAKRIAIQNPDLFDQVARELGYVKKEDK